MNSCTDRRSSSSPQNLVPSCWLAARLYPVPIGSRNTRSVWSSSVYWLSSKLYGGGGALPSGSRRTFLGPNAPRCSQTVDEPGPPLKTKVMGRVVGFAPSLVYDT